jgi:hypothetical protein
MLSHPRQRLNETGVIVADRDRGDRRPDRCGHLQRVRIPVRVAADDGIHHFCQHGHVASELLPVTGSTVDTGLGGDTERHICKESHAHARTGF